MTAISRWELSQAYLSLYGCERRSFNDIESLEDETYFNVFGQKVSRARYLEMLNARKSRQEFIAAQLGHRDFLKMGMLTSAGMLVAQAGLSARAGTQDIPLLQPASPFVSPFMDEMPIMPIQQPVRRLNPPPTILPNTAAGEGRTIPHQALRQFPPQKNDTRVIVDHVPFGDIARSAQSEVKARKGHDLVMFPSPPASYERHVINHAEVHQEVWGKQGQFNQLGYKSSYSPKTQKFFAFADSYIPTSFNYRRDYWMQIGVSFGPSNYDSLRLGGKQIREKLGIPCGLGLAQDLDSNVALHGLLLSFGGSVQDARGNVTINSQRDD